MLTKYPVSARVQAGAPLSWLCILAITLSLLIPRATVAAEPGVPAEGLQLWLRADEGVEEAGGKVRTWYDQSGNDRHAASNAGTEPELVLEEQTGMPALRFDGHKTYLRVAHDEALNSTRGLSVFIVYKYTDGFRAMQKKDNADAISADGWFITPLGGLGAGGKWDRGHHFGKGTLYVASNVFNPAAREIRIYGNGSLRGVVTDTLTPQSNSDDLFIGKRHWPARTEGHLEGYIFEILIYNRPVTEAERQQVERYLIDKYIERRPEAVDVIETTALWISQVKYQDPGTGIYLGSPSLVRLDESTILASHDYFGPNAPTDGLGRPHTTSVYMSEDNGETWQHLTDLKGIYWATLFTHRGAVYLMGSSAGPGDIVIRRSDDRGRTWTTPVDAQSGLLFPGGRWGTPPRYHGAPVPVVEIDGRLYRAFENASDPSMPGFRDYLTLVISAPADSDLLNAENWTMSNALAYNGDWDPPGAEPGTGWAEGNVVQGPDGRIWNILRVHSNPYVDRAAMVEVHENGARVSFTPEDFIRFPGGQSKFVIRKDEVTGLYWAMTNNNTDPNYPHQRNVLSLYASRNLRDWYHVKTLMEDDQGLSFNDSVRMTGFQYPDWHFDGEDIIYLVRTAYKGARNFHDANRITFGRVENFRSLIPEELMGVGE